MFTQYGKTCFGWATTINNTVVCVFFALKMRYKYYRKLFTFWTNEIVKYFSFDGIFDYSSYALVEHILTHWNDAYMRQKMNHRWSSQWLVTYLAPSRYLNQWWFIVNWTLGDIRQWHFIKNSNIFIWKMHLNIPSAKCRPFCLGLNLWRKYSIKTWRSYFLICVYGFTIVDSWQFILVQKLSRVICIWVQWPTHNLSPGIWHEHISTVILIVAGNCLGPIWMDWRTAPTPCVSTLTGLAEVKDTHHLRNLLSIWFWLPKRAMEPNLYHL